MINNQALVKIFFEVALFLEMEGVAFKPQAYEKASSNLETLSEDVGDIYKKGGLRALEAIPGVGKGIAEKIEEYLKTGKIKDYETLKKKIPVNIEELISVEGVGPKTVKELYKSLKIKNLKDLEKAAKEHKIRELPNFGEKTEKNILQGIEFVKRSSGRFLLGEILPEVKRIEDGLKKLKEVKKVSVAGSVRRRKETIGDVDFLVVSGQPEKVMDYFTSLPGVIKVWGEGATKSSIRMSLGFDVDLRVVPEKSYGAALQYFTGSKEHNIMTRRIAIDKGLKLNEYGIFKGKKMIVCETEEEVYKILEMEYPEPELRENAGEVEAALKRNLPKIIGYTDIKGDLHTHSNWDGGADSIEEMAEAAMKMGYEYIGIADHTKFLRIERGLDEKQLLERNKTIDKLNAKLGPRFKVLKGCEANILADGFIDINDETLAQLDFVIAGVHSQLKMGKKEMTGRIIKAMKNPNVDIISHPTGRLLKQRDEYEIDIDEILKVAKETNTILEINASPSRLDLKDLNIRKAKEMGVKMIINTDSHRKDQLYFMEYGISQARRGWAEEKDIINTGGVDRFLNSLKKTG